jgi:hypothetical protein
MKKPPCPLCGAPMALLYGGGWDYDRWVCYTPLDPDARIKQFCHGEIELDTTTCYDDKTETNNDQQILQAPPRHIKRRSLD